METMNHNTTDFLTGDVSELVYYSTHLGKLLTESYKEGVLDIYAEARELGEDLPFSTLAVYVAAFADILEERLKE